MNKSWLNKPLKGVAWFVVLIVLLVAWLFWADDQTTTIKSTPNQVTDQTTEQLNSTTTSDDAEPASPTESKSTFIPTDQTRADDNDLSYLKLYRMYRQWQTCGDVIYYLEHEDEVYHPLNQLRLKIHSHHPKQTDWPTQAQEASIQRHTSQCTQLLQQLTELDLPKLLVEQSQSKHRKLQAQLLTQLQNTQAKTAKEQAIAHVLELISLWQNAMYALMQAPLNDPPPLNQDTPDYLADVLVIEPHHADINSISNQATDDFLAINQQLSQQLHTSDPDVFYEAQMALEQANDISHFGFFPFKNIGHIKHEKLLTAYISPAEVLMQLTGMHDGEWFDLVIQHASQLYLCELGADCGPQSPVINFYCHSGLLLLDPVSCDLDYTTFLQHHYLNNNQWDDVQHMLSVIRGLYAQN